MRRFSDRLTSSSSVPHEQGKVTVNTVNGNSDERLADITGEAMGSSDRDYAGFVEMLGLHQTVKALEAEYRAITGGGGENNGCDDHTSRMG